MDRRAAPRWAVLGLAVVVIGGLIVTVSLTTQPPPTPAPTTVGSTPSTSTVIAADAGPDLTPVRYYQFDKKWAKQTYGPNSGDTVRRWGCGPAAVAMAVASLSDPSVDPGVASRWSQKHGYFTHAPESGKTEPAFFADFAAGYGVQVRQLNTGDLRSASPASARAVKLRAQQAVRDGDWVIALMGKGLWTTEAHYVLWYRAEGDQVWIADSNSQREDKAHNTFSVFSQTMIRLWVVDVGAAGVQR